MNTKHIPAVVMLLGALVRCVVGLRDKDIFNIKFVISLIIVSLIFYIIGAIIKSILDKYVPLPQEEDETEDGNETDEEKELEDIQETDGQHSKEDE